jgi:NAD-dependent deacetylase
MVISANDKVLFVTGAGISASSGISAWRTGKSAVWATDVLEKGTQRYFNRFPDKAWAWYLEKFDCVENLQPNTAHHALAELEHLSGNISIITQNVDHLHKKAGSKNVIEVHGKTNAVRCVSSKCVGGGREGSIPMEMVRAQLNHFKETQESEDLPTCPYCGALVRAHALWFDEAYTSHVDYEFDKSVELARTSDMIFFVGTSFSVGITSIITDLGYRKGVPMYVVDPAPLNRAPYLKYIEQKAEDFLPSLVQKFQP